MGASDSGLLGRLDSLQRKYTLLPTGPEHGAEDGLNIRRRLFTPWDLARLLGAQAGWWKTDPQASDWEILLDYDPSRHGGGASGLVGELGALPFREIGLRHHVGPKLGWGVLYRRGENLLATPVDEETFADAAAPTEELIQWEVEILY